MADYWKESRDEEYDNDYLVEDIVEKVLKPTPKDWDKYNEGF